MPEIVDIQLKKGALDLCVLALLSRGDSYAYEIASRLAYAIDMGEGTIYPLMRRMQADGLVETYTRSLDDGINELSSVLAVQAPERTPTHICDALITAMVGEDPEDDVAQLVIRISPTKQHV